MLPMHAGACRDATNTRRSTYRSYTWVREHVGLLPMGEEASRDARKWLGSIVGILEIGGGACRESTNVCRIK